jgi:DME family drug/metabolite transporter
MSPRVAVLLAAVLFGTTGTAQALGPDGTAPLAVGSARILVGAALLALVARRLTVRGPAAWDRRVLALSGACVALYQVAFFVAVDLTGVAVGTVVAIGSGPAFAGLLARAVDGERLTRRWAAATALAAAGVGLLVAGSGGAQVDPVGVGLALVSGLGYAGYTVGAKRLLRQGHPPEAVMAWAFGIGAVVLLPVLVGSAGPWLGSPGGLALVLYLGALPTALAYVLFARGLQRLGAGETATLTLAEPLTAAALGIVVLGESPTPVAGVGAALVLGGLAVLAAGAGTEPRRRPPAGAAPGGGGPGVAAAGESGPGVAAAGEGGPVAVVP